MLIRGHNCEEGQRVAFRNLFVKLWNNLVPICNNCKMIVIELFRIVLKCNVAYFNLNMDK